jgi:hypothetical protein
MTSPAPNDETLWQLFAEIDHFLTQRHVSSSTVLWWIGWRYCGPCRTDASVETYYSLPDAVQPFTLHHRVNSWIKILALGKFCPEPL